MKKTKEPAKKLKVPKKIKMNELSAIYGVSPRTIGFWRDGSPNKKRMELFSAMKGYYYFSVPEESGGVKIKVFKQKAKEIEDEIISFTKEEVVEEQRIIDLANKAKELHEMLEDFDNKMEYARE